jgi:hypothetical protein
MATPVQPRAMVTVYTNSSQWLLIFRPMMVYFWLKEDNLANEKRTMTLNLTVAEMAVVDDLSARKELSKTGLIRQALRLYQLVDARIAQGEKLVFENELEKKKSEVTIL